MNVLDEVMDDTGILDRLADEMCRDDPWLIIANMATRSSPRTDHYVERRHTVTSALDGLRWLEDTCHTDVTTRDVALAIVESWQWEADMERWGQGHSLRT